MGQFLKQTFASIVGTLTALLLILALGASSMVLLFISAVNRDEQVKVKDETVLVFDLATPVADVQPPSSITDALAGEDTTVVTLRQVLDTIKKAAEDDQIVALFLDGRQTGGNNGYAILSEIRAALEEFRATGKLIIAYDTDWGEQDYYLSSVADTVVLHPMGTMTMNGFSAETLFLAGALEKYGVGIQVVRAGNYKSAIEPFTRQSLSPQSREQTEELLGDLWDVFLGKVAESRDLTPAKLQAIADTQGFLDAETARQAGLVDQVEYLDEVVGELKELTEVTEEDESFRQITLAKYGETAKGKTENSSENEIAVVYAEGAIVGGEGTLGQVGSDRYAKILRELREDEDIKAVVLRINSPGGSATASDIIWREVQLLEEEKPVVVSMGNVAASGAYWIATGAEYILADASTVTGSIGVFGLLPNIEEIANENGITWDIVKTGQLADLETVVRPKTEQELAIYQQYVNQTYNLFLEKVAQARDLPKEKVAQIAQGRVWSGEDAAQIGLVDQIGGLEAATEYAADQADLGDDWKIQEYPQQRRFGEILTTLLEARGKTSAQDLDLLTQQFRKFKSDLAIFQNLDDPKGVYARLPFSFWID